MNRLAISLAIISIAAFTTHAQRPQPSPPAVTIQTVGLDDVTVTYSRPGVKGRTVWGDLVPYGKVWRAGANDKTYFTFEVDTILGGQRVPPGNYSFYILPTETEWTLIFNSDWEGHGTDHNVDADILRITATPENAPHEEWLRYGFDNLRPYRATAYLHWEKKKVGFELQTAPDLPEVEGEAKAVLDAVDIAMVALLAGDYARMGTVLADDFESADLGNKEQMLATLEQLMLHDLVIDMKDAEIRVEGDTATVTGITGDGAVGELNFDVELERRNGAWLIVR